MNTQPWHSENPLDCPLVHAIGLLGGKWKPVILHMLVTEPLRFTQLQKQIAAVSQKVLTQQLRELESDHLIIRTVYPEVPPRVDYRLSEDGLRLVPILNQLYAWGAAQRPH